MPIDKPAPRIVQNSFSEKFIQRHTPFQSPQGEVRHRAQKDPNVPQSTQLSALSAIQMARDFDNYKKSNAYKKSDDQKSGTSKSSDTNNFSRVDRKNSQHNYSGNVSMTNYNASGRPQNVRSNNITVGVNDEDKIHHFESQKSHSNTKTDGK
ncbi:hypothetical protein [Burkholderia ubonensis]|uniref:hypothetical protein n=1 Tax=Burkholderia ubonensis TaxID=101571 RepID=UPI000B2A0BF1|nr:hypothetical protein [Burkholderia ubonensis]